MSKITSKSCLRFALLFFLLAQAGYGQKDSAREARRTTSTGEFHYFTVQLGMIQGPSVSAYTTSLNRAFATLGSSDRIEDFGPNLDIGLGVCASISRHFSYQFNLNLYSFQTEGTFNYTAGDGETVVHRQELSFGGATFGLNFLVNPTLKAETRLWPFFGAGIGLVSFFLDELVDFTVEGYPFGGVSARRTKIALGGGVVCGAVYKVSRRWGLIFQAEYLLSKAEMDFSLAHDQEIELHQGLLKVGTIYLY